MTDPTTSELLAEIDMLRRENESLRAANAPRELRDAQLLLASLLDNTPTPIHIATIEGRYVLVNRAWEEAFHKKRADVVGRMRTEVLPRAAAERFTEIGRQVAELRAPLTLDECADLNGDVHYFHAVKFPLFDDDGTVSSIGGISVEITDRKRAEEALDRQRHELLRSNADLEQFAYVTSHDLQEPLRMVSSYLQLLQKRYSGRLDRDAEEFIGFAVDGATRMQALIKDLLAYSRVAARPPEVRCVDSGEVLQDVLRNLSATLESSGAAVVVGPLPAVNCDRLHIGQLFQNLIANAVKFRSDRAIHVEIGADWQDGYWRFVVRDNGIGIDALYTDKIFIIFQRLHTRDEYPGTGIGLAICKKIVEHHGGNMWVESEPGHGSAFFFTLPGIAPAATL